MRPFLPLTWRLPGSYHSPAPGPPARPLVAGWQRWLSSYSQGQAKGMHLVDIEDTALDWNAGVSLPQRWSYPTKLLAGLGLCVHVSGRWEGPSGGP